MRSCSCVSNVPAGGANVTPIRDGLAPLTGQTRDTATLQSVFVSIRGHVENYIARRVSSREIAEDMASEIYLRLDRAEMEGDGVEDARRYIFRIASNMAIDHARTTRRRGRMLEVEAATMPQDGFPSAEQLVMARADLAIVADAVDELPELAREILFAARMHGMSHAEIASRFGVSVSLVEKYLLRSVRHCKARLNEAAGEEEEGSKIRTWYKSAAKLVGR
ncbi:RNA polymerase sigma factor [Sphingopyxis sp. YR583]|uniref:RNA polymerase sigma factor n=1 Tax=Sphingopyxis sp. YR583 TaxID=1881047 RepID=UPI0015A5C1C9|nr:RNA polymerase sigma factor [Sphingopyxis sp. YR583]